MRTKLEELIQRAQRIIEEANSEALSLGFKAPTRPQPITIRKRQYDGQIPTELTSLTNEDLGRLLSYTNQWVSYYTVKHVEIRGRRKILQEALKDVKEKAKKGDVDITTHPAYIELKDTLQMLEYLEQYAEASLSVAKSNYNTVSRIISLRQSEMERKAREWNVQQKDRPRF